MQTINLLTGLSCRSLGLAGREAGSAVQTPQLSNICKEKLLVLIELDSAFGVRTSGIRLCGGFLEESNEGGGLVARLGRNVQNIGEARLSDGLVDGHGDDAVDLDDETRNVTSGGERLVVTV